MGRGVSRAGMMVICSSALVGCGAEAVQRRLAQGAVTVPTPNVEPGTLFRGTFSPDGDVFYFFVKIAEDGEDYRVFESERTSSGWSEPTMIPLGDPTASSMYPVVSPDGEMLVFTSYRSAGDEASNANLWAARRESGQWSEPFLLREASTPENYDAGPWFGPDGELRFASISADWSTTWRRRAPRTGDSFGPATEDTFWRDLEWPRATHHFWGGILNRAGTLAVIELAAREPDGSLASSDLWVSRRQADGWSEPVALAADVNTAGTENFAAFAPDDSTLVYVRGFTSFHTVVVR